MTPKKILVVEDDKVIQKLIADTLKAAGYEVLTARNSATAVKLAREEEPDLVTLDIELAKDSPDDSWDGFSVAGWLRRLHEGKQKPILVVISGSREPDKIVEQASALGVHTCLTKPVDKKQLLEAVAGALK
jgi:two-component system, OmpR family, alkaline phosphatase synthesis response regulator PhoP